jgi:hypothetical protein
LTYYVIVALLLEERLALSDAGTLQAWLAPSGVGRYVVNEFVDVRLFLLSTGYVVHKRRQGALVYRRRRAEGATNSSLALLDTPDCFNGGSAAS